MNKRKILTLAMTLCMVAILAIGGTLAYFTDTDSAKNVMVSGNVDIIQNEKQRDETGNALEDFEDGKLLVPAVFYNEDGTVKPADGAVDKADVPTHKLVAINEVNGDQDNLSDKLLDKSLTNEVDKIVSVTNNGKQPVYVRTIFLIEDKLVDATKENKQGKYLSDYVMEMWTENGNQSSGNYNHLRDANGDPILVTIGNTSYSIQVHYYNTILQPGKTTAASLKQFYLDPNATNDFYQNLGVSGSYDILALSQAVQSQGFEDVGERAALNEAFGEVTVDNCKDWFANVK